jgi:hypothetical protein
VVNLWISLLLCTDDDEVEPIDDEGEDDKFQGSRGGRKMPRPLDGDDCAALAMLPVIETTATKQTPSAVAV